MYLAQVPLLDPWAIFAAALSSLKPFLLVLLLIVAVRVVLIVLKTRWLRRAGLPEIEQMDGRDFEEKLALLFERKRYRVERTPYVGDWGADLIVASDGRRTAVQVKRWKGRVGPRAIQEAVASKAKYRCQEALVVTNSYFTLAARELAKANGVELWNRERLARELLSVASPSVNRQNPLSSIQSVGEVPKAEVPVPGSTARSNPKCYKCGREMVLKENARGKFWACSGFPRCRNTFPVRKIASS